MTVYPRLARVPVYGFSPASRIGTEHEKLGFVLGNNRRLSYDQIAHILRALETRFGWEPILEEGRIIGVQLDGQSVTLEPGGQFELSGAPVETLHKTCAEVNSHLYQVSYHSVASCATTSSRRRQRRVGQPGVPRACRM
jgi:glutamate--cysteine ligase